MAMTDAQKKDAYQFFIVAFGAAPGVTYMNQLNDAYGAGMTSKQIVNVYTTKSQFQAIYPAFMSNTDFASKLIENVVGTSATDAAKTAAKADVVAALNAGWTRGDTIYQIFTNLAAKTTDATWGGTATMLANKVTVAQYFTETKLVATTDLGALQALVAGVTSDPASVAAAQAAGNQGQTFTLTENTDTATANVFNSGMVYTPGGTDRINALQDEDTLTGTGTNPTLNATLGNANDNGAAVITPKLNGIETVNVAFTGSGAAVTDLDMQDAVGLDTVNITRISQASNVGRVENIKQVVSTLGLANTNANDAAGVAEFSFGTDVLKGNNAVELNVSNVQISAVNIGNNTSGVAANGVGVQGYEEVTLNSTGASNIIGNLRLPMDTGTAGKLTITGDQNLTLAQVVPVINAATTTVESTRFAGGVQLANGRLSAIDASGLAGNLTLNIAAGLLSTGKADTSGVAQNVTITGGEGDDKFILGDIVQAGDSIDAGAGTDTLVVTSAGVVNATSSVIKGVENVEIRAAVGGAVTVDFDKLPDTLLTVVRNEGAGGVANPDAPVARALVTNLNNLTAVEAAALKVEHSNTGSNGILQNTINATLKTAAGAADLVSLTIAEGYNVDPRFNLILATQNAAGATGGVENVTLVDSDTESNTVALASVAQHTGTVKMTGGQAGTFLNLDTTVAGANGGLYQYDVTGAADLNSSAAGATVGRVADQSAVAGQVKLVAATVDASAEASNVVVRVSTNAASAVGAQSITMGAGNDTVIFDNLADNRAGLTISDTVAGGAGSDALVIDGNVAITLGASEWTNVSGFETVRVIGNGVAANNAAGGVNSYNLTLTNNLLAANKDANGLLNVVSDNDLFNDTGRTLAQAAAATVLDADGVARPVANDVAANSGGVTIDARTLSAGSKWSFNGNEGVGGRSADRIILSDANIDGNAVIDGGAVDNITNNSGVSSLNGTSFVGQDIDLDGSNITALGNADVIEVRNAAVVAQGDLANVKNIGTLSFTNDLAVTQVSTLQLNDSIVDNLVDSYQASVSRAAAATTTVGGANVEVLRINAVDNVNVAAATTGLNIEAGTLTDKSDLSVTLGRGANVVATGAGQDRVVLLGNYVAGTYAVVENGVNINAQSTAGALARVVTDNINLGGGNDTLVTYGAINLVGATLAGVETITANSAVVITASQWNALVAARAALSLTGPVLTFVGNSTHQLTIVDDVAGANNIDLSLISLTGGSLTFDITSSSNATGGNVNNLTFTNAVVDTSTTGDAVAGVVGTTPTNNTTLTSVFVDVTAGGTSTGTAGTNDIFRVAVASLSPTAPAITTITGTAADTETVRMTTAGTFTLAAAGGAGSNNVTNVDKLELFDGTNSVSFTGTTGVKDILGGTGADSIALTNITTGGAISLGAGNDNLTALTVAIATAAGATFNGGADTDTVTFADGETITAGSLAGFSNIESVVFGAIGATSVVTLVNGITSINANLTTDSRNLTVTGTGAQFSALTSITNGDNDSASTFNLTVSDAGATVDLVGDTLSSDVDAITFQNTGANFLKIDATNLAKIAATVVAAGSSDTLELSTTAIVANTRFDAFDTIQAAAGTTAIDITDSGISVARSIIGNAGANTITLGVPSAAKSVNISSGGVDTISVSDAGSALTTITGFTAGSGTGADILNLGTAGANALLPVTMGASGVVTTGATLTGAATDPSAGLVLSGASFQVSGALTQVGDGGAVEAAIIAAGLIQANTASLKSIVVLDNGTDTGVYLVTRAADAGGTATVLDNASDFSVVQIAQLVGIADAGTLAAANIV